MALTADGCCGPGAADGRRQQLLEALAFQVGPLPDEAFSWRRKAGQAAMDTAAAEVANRQHETVEQLRCRLLASSDRGASPAMSQAPVQQDEAVKPTPRAATLPSTQTDSPPSLQAAPAPDDRRQQFLDALSRGLHEVDIGFSSSRKASKEACSASEEGPGLLDCPRDDVPLPAGRPASPADAVASVLGHDFFSGINALQERMAQRKLDSQSRGTPAAATSTKAVATAAPAPAAFPAPAQQLPAELVDPLAEMPQGAGPTAPSFDPPLPRRPLANPPAHRRRGPSPRATNRGLRLSFSPASSCRGTPSSAGPTDSPIQTQPRGGFGGGTFLKMPKSEQRRRLEGRSDGDSDAEALVADSTDDEKLLSGGASDELLRWAEEVLRKAAGVTAMDEEETMNNAFHATTTASAAQPPPLAGRPRIAATSPSVHERQRRADELRDEIRRLTEESEFECRQLEQAEMLRRQRSAAQDESWRRRVTSAAQEIRNNRSHLSFDNSAGCNGGGTSWRPSRGSSVPPQPRPGLPPTPTPTTFMSCQRRVAAEQEALWARLEGKLEGASGPILFADIPWPDDAHSITGVLPCDTVLMMKRKLAGALRRWHPDKWRRILDRVPETEQARVMERVKNIAQRLLEEKAKLAGPGGLL